MDEKERGEINRLHAEIGVVKLLVARLAAHRWDEAELRAWHDRVLRQFEQKLPDQPDVLANLTTALDELGVAVRDARRNVDRRRPPG